MAVAWDNEFAGRSFRIQGDCNSFLHDKVVYMTVFKLGSN